MKTILCVGLSLTLAAHAGTAADDKLQEKVVKATGTLEPEEVIDIGAQVAGKIQQFGVDPNDKNKTIDFNSVVKKGTVLARLDPTTYEVAVDRARASVQRAERTVRLARAKANLAERELDRVKKRYAAKTAEAAEVEIAQAAVEVARARLALEEATLLEVKAELRMAEINLEYCTLRSPVSGVVIDRRCNAGQAVFPSLNAPSLFLIATNLKRLQVWARVREADIAQVRVGQTARFTVEAFPKQIFRGRVGQIRLNATLNKSEVSYTVVLEVDNSDGKLLPYMTAQVSIEAGERP